MTIIRSMRGAWYDFVRWFVRNTFFRLTGGLRAVGRENVPFDGAVIIAPLHVSNLDPPAVACACPRRLNFMAKEELFKVPVLGPIIRSLDAFPVKRGEGDTEAIRLTLSLLEQGRTVIVFPEGTRGDGKTIQPINKGVTMLARRSGAWVVPVGLVGSHIVLPKGQSKPKRGRITVAFGKPFRYADIQAANEREARELFASRLQQSIIVLCNENGLPIRNESSLPRLEASAAGEISVGSKVPDSSDTQLPR